LAKKRDLKTLKKTDDFFSNRVEDPAKKAYDMLLGKLKTI
jgi:hypothetical protein